MALLFPIFTFCVPSNTTYLGRVNAISFRQLRLVKLATFVKRTHFSNVLPVQFSDRIILSRMLALKTSAATFVHHVSHVVQLSSQKQMIGIYTQPIVASVENKHASRDFPASKNPTRPMSHKGSTPPRSRPAVSPASSTGCPYPTIWCFLNVRPKVVWEGLVKSLRFEVFSGKFNLHNQSSFGFATSSAIHGAGTLSFSVKT
jgi:hypothetical protein